MNIAVYARVSTQRQAQTQSIEQQLECLQAHCQSQEWELLPEHIFRDDGFSGATLNRPSLDRLRDQVKAGQVDRVLITTPDRLARKYVRTRRIAWDGHGAARPAMPRPRCWKKRKDYFDVHALRVPTAGFVVVQKIRHQIQRFLLGAIPPANHPHGAIACAGKMHLLPRFLAPALDSDGSFSVDWDTGIFRRAADIRPATGVNGLLQPNTVKFPIAQKQGLEFRWQQVHYTAQQLDMCLRRKG